jgi:hypothetical protein
MHAMIGWGTTVVVLAALLNGSFTAPIKKMSGWQWENTGYYLPSPDSWYSPGC